ncbi:polysaccharide deacetylase family protein [Rhizobium sp. BR 314]|uniref:polysaccharide deacetylase family protein n=1 Tax=Rhizobium sp. BR 314 TaxID=3040013 RepID=UPI0039BFFC68
MKSIQRKSTGIARGLRSLFRWAIASAVALTAVSYHAGAQALRQEPCSAPSQRSVAITFDDLPYSIAGDPEAQNTLDAARDANASILAALDRYRAPATGFVVERRVRALGQIGEILLAPWNQGHLELGNHSFGHRDSNDLSLDEFRREVTDGEATIDPMVRKAGRSLRFFRFPYNHVGDIADRREAFETVLRERGYRIAASTIDTSDYLFDAAHEHALTVGDEDMRQRIETAYLDYSRTEIAYYADLNRQVLGCEPPAVMLLHLNRINASVMDRLLEIFQASGYRFASLDEAQAHPAYASSPRFVTKFGPMWGYRWARDHGVKVDGSKEQEPPAWIVSYGKSPTP